MPYGKGTYGDKVGRPKKTMKTPAQKAKSKIGRVRLGGKTINFKKGALRSMFKMKPSQKFTKSMMRAMLKKKDGEQVDAFGTRRKMTKLLRKRLNFGLTLMKL
jgi:hypothetical protein